MALDQCVDEISAAVGRRLSRTEALDIMAAVEGRRKRLQAENAMLSAEAAARRAAAGLADEARLAAAIEKRNAYLNLTKRVARRAFYARAPRVGRTPGILIGLEAKLVGINTPFAGSRASVDAEARAMHKDWLGGLAVELDRAGLFETVRRGDLDDKWAAELFELSRGERGRPGVTGDAHAQEIARAVHKYQTLSRQALNAEGAWVGAYDGYVTRTTHDPDRIRRAGYDAWRTEILPRLDMDRTFADVDDPEGFLRGVWDALVTGTHLTPEGMQGFKDPAFAGPANLAKKLSSARHLHFRDAAAWVGYHRAFGTGTLIETVLRQLDLAARHTALMRAFGTNPAAEFDADLRWLAETRRGDTETALALRAREKALRNRFAELDGTAQTPMHRVGARIGSGWRAVQAMAKLGGVVLSAIGDVPLKAAELRYQGVGLLEAYGDGFASVARGRGRGEVREIADLLRAGTEGMVGNIASRFDAADTTPGALSKVQNVFFRWTGLSYWTDAQRAGAETVLARHLGRQRDRAWGALRPETRRALAQFGVSAGEWEALRGVDWRQADGRTYLTPDRAGEISDAAADGVLAPQIAAAEGAVRAAKMRLAEADAREAGWIARRQAKLADKLDRARTRLRDRAARLGDRAAAFEARQRDRIALLEARVERAEVETDLLQSLKGLDTQDQVRALLDAVEGGEEAARVAGRADRRVERSLAGALRAGERLGARRRAAEARIAEIEKRIAGETEAADAAIVAADAEFVDLFAEREAELVAFVARVQERTAARAAQAAALEVNLPLRIERLRDRWRRDLGLKLHAYFTDRGEYAVINPGARERAILRRGTRAGTVEGEALRLIGQFKAFPVAVISRAWGRELYGGQGGFGKVGGIVHMLVASTVFGYLAMAAKDLAKGRAPRDPADPKTWAAAFVQGGGAGIYGDFIVGEYNRFGRSLLASLAGPTLGQIDDVAEIWNRVKSGDDPAAQALRTLVANTPFANLFYTRAALDYLFLYQVQEALNPGFLRRFERRVARENKQRFLLKPSEAVPYGGGDRFLEGVR